MERDCSDIPTTDNLEVVKWCPLCEKKGVRSQARFYQINFNEAIFTCSETECAFPFSSEYIPIYIKRDALDIWDADKTPVVTRADVLKEVASVTHVSTLLKRFLAKQEVDLLRKKKKTGKRVRFAPTEAELKVQEQMAQILGDFSFVLNLQASDTEGTSDPSVPASTSDFDHFMFDNPTRPTNTLRKQRRRKLKIPFNYRRRKYKRKETNKTNKSEDSVVDQDASVDSNESCGSNTLQINNLPLVDTDLIATEQTSYYNNNVLNGDSESDCAVGNVSSLERNAKSICTFPWHFSPPTNDLNYDDACENFKRKKTELSNGSKCVFDSESVVIDVCSDQFSHNFDKETGMRCGSIANQSVAENYGDQEICDKDHRNMLTPNNEVDCGDLCGFNNGENNNQTLFGAVKSTGLPSEHYGTDSVLKEDHVKISNISSEDKSSVENMDDSVSIEICDRNVGTDMFTYIFDMLGNKFVSVSDKKPPCEFKLGSEMVNSDCSESSVEMLSCSMKDTETSLEKLNDSASIEICDIGVKENRVAFVHKSNDPKSKSIQLGDIKSPIYLNRGPEDQVEMYGTCFQHLEPPSEKYNSNLSENNDEVICDSHMNRKTSLENIDNSSSLEMCHIGVDTHMATSMHVPSIPEIKHTQTSDIGPPTIFKCDSENKVNFFYRGKCEKASAHDKGLEASQDKFMEKGNAGHVGIRYLLALKGLSLPSQNVYEDGQLVKRSIPSDISYYNPHLFRGIFESSQVKSCVSPPAPSDVKGKALQGRNAGRKKSSYREKTVLQKDTSVTIGMASHDVSLKGDEPSFNFRSHLRAEQTASTDLLENCPPALPPGVPSTSSLKRHSEKLEFPGTQELPTKSNLKRVKLTEQYFVPSDEFIISVW